MSDIKKTVAANIAALRQSAGMTQLELAERLNYSDKAVSKWERGESCPDVPTLTEMSELFRVPLDYFVHDEHPEPPPSADQPRYHHSVITCVAIGLVWFVMLFIFVILSLTVPQSGYNWLCFIHALPISCIVWLVLNSVWFNRRVNYIIISVLMWTTLLAVHLSLLPVGLSVPIIYLLGIPGQIILLLWSFMKRRR